MRYHLQVPEQLVHITQRQQQRIQVSLISAVFLQCINAHKERASQSCCNLNVYEHDLGFCLPVLQGSSLLLLMLFLSSSCPAAQARDLRHGQSVRALLGGSAYLL
jgi:hypothetical protein